MDVAHLLASHGPESPSGVNLEYEQIFIEMQIAALPEEERQAGDRILPAEDPDFRDLARKAEAVLGQSHDLRAAVLLGWARLQLDGLAGLAEATSYIRGCLTEHWDSCHPQLDAEDDGDPTMRVNAVQALADDDTLLRTLRVTPLTHSRAFGKFNLADIRRSEAGDPAEDDDTAPDPNAVSAAFCDTDEAAIAALLAAVAAALADVAAIDACFDDHTPGQGPDLAALTRILRQIEHQVSEHTGVPVAESAAESDAVEAVGAPMAGLGPETAAASGDIASPQDVTQQLDRIIDYYQSREPSSPVPILLARAKRLVNADFMTIMQDMAPSGLDSVRMIGGVEE